MKIGDLVKWCSVQNDEQEEFDIDYGIIVDASSTRSAPPAGVPINTVQVVWADESISWMNTKLLEIVNEK